MHNRFTSCKLYSARVHSYSPQHSSEQANSPDEEEGEVDSTAGRFRDIPLSRPVRMGHTNSRSKFRWLRYTTHRLGQIALLLSGMRPGRREFTNQLARPKMKLILSMTKSRYFSHCEWSTCSRPCSPLPQFCCCTPLRHLMAAPTVELWQPSRGLHAVEANMHSLLQSVRPS